MISFDSTYRNQILGGIIFSLIYFVGKAQPNPSVLASGIWIKFSVQQEGLYRIRPAQLRNAGIDLAQVNPNTIQLYTSTTGMLPQPNATARTNHLQEVAILVEGEEDGSFDDTDYILFYGQSPDAYHYDTKKNVFFYQKNLYSDYHFYFLTLGTSPGKRLDNRTDLAGSYPKIDTYNDLVYHERDDYNILRSGRKWFGEKVNSSDVKTLSFDLSGIVTDAPLTIISGVMAQSVVASSFRWRLNDVFIVEQTVNPIFNTRFGIQGREKIDTIRVMNPSLNSDSPQQFTYEYTSTAQQSTGYLDRLLVSYERYLSLYGDQTVVRSQASLAQPISTFEIESFPSQGMIIDITNPYQCVNQLYHRMGSRAVFSTPTNNLKTFIVVAPNRLLEATLEGRVANQNLYVNRHVDLLIVTHPDFRDEANRLANHRATYNGLATWVVTPKEIYNDYSGGKQDPTAIRDMVKKLLSQGLKNLLLVGKCSYDYKNRLVPNTNFVPTYSSRNSLAPLETYSSDDYFAFLETTEGMWEETKNGTPHTMDIGVGRLPVKTRQEAKEVVDKLITYDTSRTYLGSWRKKILFIADDGDGNLHQRNADALAQPIAIHHPDFDIQKIYLDAFEQPSRPSGQVSPKAREALRKALAQGVLIANFTGHGSEDVWCQEKILDESFIEAWENDKAYPLLVTATCEFGRQDDPYRISGGEKTLLKNNGGAIALVTASRPVNSSSNTLLNTSFYDALFRQTSKKNQSIGTIFRDTKNGSLKGIGVSNRNFSLLGDPSMHLAIPTHEINISSLQTKEGSPVLNVLSSVIVKGKIYTSGGDGVVDFNGSIDIVLQDKEIPFNTLGDPVDSNIIITYYARSNTLFRGKASVVNGSFQLEFIMPATITLPVGKANLSLYAVDELSNMDAFGSMTSIMMSDVPTTTNQDQDPPTIQLFMEDETFVDGGITSSNPTVGAVLFDPSGINVASHDLAYRLTLILDGDQYFDISNYYVADQDDFKSGKIFFPLRDLSSGLHTLELKASDAYYNARSSFLTFEVTKNNRLVVRQLKNYPNPFSTTTTISFSHNRPGQHLAVSLIVVNTLGKVIDSKAYDIPVSQYVVTLPEWSLSTPTNFSAMNGVYIARLIVHSFFDNSKIEDQVRMILVD